VHILVATDADYVVNDVTAALGGPDVSFTIVSEGRDVARVVASARLTSPSSTCRSAPREPWR
jgi:hypothetical protein